MRKAPKIAYCWPGLPALWYDGAWRGLALAVGYALAIDLLLLVSLVWVEWWSAWAIRLGWGAAAAVWLAATLLSRGRQLPELEPSGQASPEDLFPQALNEYLLGNAFEAEAILVGILRKQPRDVEARLLLATLLRHGKRFAEAREQLDDLEKLDGAVRWRIEIEAERRFLAEAQPGPEALLERLWTNGLPERAARAA